MDLLLQADRPSILHYLHDPDLPADLIDAFFSAAMEFADARPWCRLAPGAHFPILIDFPEPPGARRLAMILGGEQSGGDALGLVLVEDLPDEGAQAHPALTVLYAGYPEPGLAPIRWRGEPLPRSRAGLLAWPTVHDVDDRVRAPRRGELRMLTGGLRAVLRFLDGYPGERLDDQAPRPYRCELEALGMPLRASTFQIPA